jgi:putative tryptophan/tyrosine transport system substrate-binding protein
VKRRDFIVGLGSAAALPLAARAQQPAIPVVAFVNGASADGYAPMVAAFRQGLKESGYVEGQSGGRIPLGGGPIRPSAGDGG